ncbi:MAG: gliding motility-associated protein GldE [Chitinophagales bacterium]|nr:gliding motility-associated protein GldE [Chitinophagales bacterium]
MFVSISKYAVFSLNQQQVTQIRKQQRKKYKILEQFIQKPKQLLATYLFAITFFCFGIVLLTENLFSTWFYSSNQIENRGIYLFLRWLILTLCLLFFVEIIPRIYGRKHNLKWSKRLIYLVWFFNILFKPFTKLFVVIAELIDKQMENNSNNLTAEDIDDAIDNTTADEHKKKDSQILKGLIKFGNITVSQIMRSRIDVVAVDKSITLSQLLAMVKDSGYSRIPVYEESIDKISGIIYAKDLLLYLDETDSFDWQKLIKPAFFVPVSKKIDDLLEDFQNKRIHMAVIVDEYGGTLGIVTLEDVLEEVIGEIKDEFDDVAEIDFKKIDNNNYIFEARTAINDIYKVLDIKDDVFDEIRGDSDSLAGLVLELNHDIPKEGDELTYKNYNFIILEANDTRIIRVKIVIK